MVFCDFCRKFSEQDYRCPNCNSILKMGIKITCQFTEPCDRCGLPLHYKKMAFESVDNEHEEE